MECVQTCTEGKTYHKTPDFSPKKLVTIEKEEAGERISNVQGTPN